MKATIEKHKETAIDVEKVDFWEVLENVGLLAIVLSQDCFSEVSAGMGGQLIVCLYSDLYVNNPDATVTFIPETDTEKKILSESLYFNFREKNELYVAFLRREFIVKGKRTEINLETV